MPTLTPAPPTRRDQPTVSVSKALGSVTRAGIYEHLREQGEPCTVRDIAAAFDVHPNVARSHLDTLVDAGLAEIGRRKNPAGGRPANVYRARPAGATPAASHLGPLPQRGALQVRLLGRLLDEAADDRSLPARAFDLAAREGRDLAAHQGSRSDLPSAAAAAIEVLGAYAPALQVINATTEWVDLAGLDTLFAESEGVRGDVAEALARGLVCGALAALGVPAALADAGTLPTGEPVWRARATAAVEGVPSSSEVAKTVDARKLHREAGVVQAMRAVTGLAQGQVLEVLTAGPGSPAAFARWADRAGHQLLGVERAVDATGQPAIRLLIRKGR